MGAAALAGATDVTIHLNGITTGLAKDRAIPMRRSGLPPWAFPRTAFPVEYINGAGNSLAVVRVHGMSLIFANVMSGSGARYAAGQYIWWEAAGSVNFYSDSLAGKMQSACHRVHAK